MTEHKKFEDLGEEEPKELKIEFAPGCFDSFEGSQEELDELVAQIKEMFASGEVHKLARPLEADELDEYDLDVLAKLDAQSGRTLQ